MSSRNPSKDAPREGLLERSKRIFGDNALRGSSSPEKRGGHGADASDPTSSYQRRRSQVRKAQRTHRERKENYLKSLEHEVINLRQQVKQQARNYEHDINALKNVVLGAGLQLPALRAEEAGYLSESSNASDKTKQPRTSSPMALVSLSEDANLGGNALHVDWSSTSGSASLSPPPNFDQAALFAEAPVLGSNVPSHAGSSSGYEPYQAALPERPLSTPAYGAHGEPHQHALPQANYAAQRYYQPPNYHPQAVPPQPNLGQQAGPPPSDLDNAQVGMEFILSYVDLPQHRHHPRSGRRHQPPQ